MQTPGPKNMKRIRGVHNLGEQAIRCKAQSHPEGVCVDATGMWEESDVRNIRGGLPNRPRGLGLPRGGVMSGQKSAEGIVVRPTRTKART